MTNTIKLLTFCLVFTLFSLTSFAQKNEIHNCSSDHIHEQMLLDDPVYKEKKEKELKTYKEKILSTAQGQVANKPIIYTLPVVFHIIHSGEPEGAYGNPSDDHIMNKLANSNMFTRVSPDISNYGVDTEIELCLAHQDPDGNYTNGIVRYYEPDIAGIDFDIDFGKSIAWDQTRYVNIIMTGTISHAAAYYVGGSYDFMVTRKGLPAVPHELGHYLSLAHTFAGCSNNDCFADGDRVCDTPPSSSPTSGNIQNTCNTDSDDTSINNPFRPTSMGGLGDVNDMLQNMMDYGPGGLFTLGQKTKMRNNIEVSRMDVLNNGSVCSSIASFTNDVGLFRIGYNQLLKCDNDLDLVVHFANYGSSTLTQTQFEVSINGNNFYTETWAGTLESGATFHHILELQDLPSGNYTITVGITSPNGNLDENLVNNSTSVDVNIFDADDCFIFSDCQDMNPNTSGGPGNNTIVNISNNFPVNNISFVELCVETYGDVSSTSEVFDVYSESGLILGTTIPTSDCKQNAEQVCFAIQISDYLSWVADGQITFTFNPTSNVINPTSCFNSPNQVCAYIQVGQDYPCTGAGSPCSDGDDCTINDVYDADCNCVGTFQDADNDSVCDLEDVCNGNNDNAVPTLKLQLDYFSEHISWSVNQGSQTILSQSYTTDDRRLYVDEKICLTEGCYDFVINDSNCKGLIEYQDGFFILEDAYGIVLGTGSNFGCSQTVSFCVTNTPCDLAGQTCDDGDACTVNEVYNSNCECVGTTVDNDNDGVCALDDCDDNNASVGLQQPQGTSCDDNNPLTIDDVILADGCTCQGTSPCSGYALDNWSSNTLTHSGAGSNSITYTFGELRENIEFEITGIGNNLSGNPSKQYMEEVTITYTDEGGGVQTYGTYSNVYSVQVSFVGPASSVTVTLTDGQDGDSGSSIMYISLNSNIASCLYASNCDSNGGDADNDGICADVDCDDNDPLVGSVTCSSNSPLPTSPGLYTAEHSAQEGNWTYYCDCEGKLLLALDKTNAPTLDVSPNQVSVEIDNGASFYGDQTGFIDNPDGAVYMNTKWEVNPSTQPGTGEEVGVKFYFSNTAYTSLNDELVSMNPDWAITSSADLIFYKVTNDALGDFPNINNIQSIDRISLTNGSPSTYSFEKLHHPNTQDHYAEFKVTSFSGGGGGSNAQSRGALPVELVSFKGVIKKCTANIIWKVASEENFSHYEIERSDDGSSFLRIGSINGTNSSSFQFYGFEDKMMKEENYYRLKMVDLDGSFEYSNPIFLSSDCSFSHMQIFPNPTSISSGIININIESKSKFINLKITDLLGRTIKILSLEVEVDVMNAITLDISDLSEGRYFLSMNDGRLSKMFIVVE